VEALFDLKSLGELYKINFAKRVNRFAAIGEHNGQKYKIHVADSGRLEEILTPNREILCIKNPPSNKTDFTLVAVKMEEGWILINTKLHSKIALAAIKRGILGFIPKRIASEVKIKESRLDFVADETFVELKGCSLVSQKRCLFPNAPTTRGVKHLKTLCALAQEGKKAAILIMGLRKCECFEPHPTRDPEFKNQFAQALSKGVDFKGFFIRINEDLKIEFDGEMKLCDTI